MALFGQEQELGSPVAEQQHFLVDMKSLEELQIHQRPPTETDQFQCANCSHTDFHLRKMTDFVFCDSQGDESILTVLEAISEIFNIKLEPLLIMSCYEDLKLCPTCGLNLAALYKCYKQFTQISALDSIITRLLKMDPNSVGPSNLETENDKKKSLRKNPKQFVRFDNTTTDLSSKRSWKSKHSFVVQDPKSNQKHQSQQPESTTAGTSSGLLLTELKEEFISDEGGGGDSLETCDYPLVPEPMTLDIGVTSHGEYHCLNCGKVFPTKAGIILHLGFKHNINKDEAQSQCKHPSIVEQMSKFKGRDKIEVKRKRKSVAKEDRIPLPCPHCNKSSWNQRDLNNHINSVHLKVKPFACPLCEKRFSRKQQVEAHLKVHSGIKASLCSLCGKQFSSAGALKGHLDRHFPKSAPPPNPVKFKCNLCDVFCTDMRRLNEHKLRHQDERNFPCDHCEKRFKTRRDLVKHRNYHKLKLEKPEQCPACEKRYSTKEILKFHLHSTHHYSLEDARAAAGIGLAAVTVYD